MEVIRLYNGITRYIWLTRIYPIGEIESEIEKLKQEGEDISIVDSDYVVYSPEMNLRELITAKW